MAVLGACLLPVLALLLGCASLGGSWRLTSQWRGNYLTHHASTTRSLAEAAKSPPPPPAPAELCVCKGPSQLLNPVYADPCILGPSYWCVPDTSTGTYPRLAECNVDVVKNISSCNFSNNVCPVVGDVTTFCNTSSLKPLTYDGGVVGLPPGYTGYYALAMYWPPTSCYSNSNPSPGGFCSAYTYNGTVGGRTMQLHGLWPDFGSLYDTYGTPPFPNDTKQTGSYQGYSMYCSPLPGRPNVPDASQCHINGGLCPDPVVSQFDYEFCMRKHNISQCTVPESVVQTYFNDFAEYAAGYLGGDRTFIDHEWNKHGSCMPGVFSWDLVRYWGMTIKWAKRLRDPAYAESAATLYIQANRGKSVPVTEITRRLNGQGVPRCTGPDSSPRKTACMLSEIWYCAGRDMAGNVVGLITCPPGTLSSDSCSPDVRGSCPNVLIPDFEQGPNQVS